MSTVAGHVEALLLVVPSGQAVLPLKYDFEILAKVFWSLITF